MPITGTPAGGIKRRAPDTHRSDEAERPTQQARKETPAEILARLKASFKETWEDDGELDGFLEALSEGRLPDNAQETWDDLLVNLLVAEEFAAMAAVFNQCVDNFNTLPADDQRPFKPVFRLALMQLETWQPQDNGGMRNAFQSLRAQRLEVHCLEETMDETPASEAVNDAIGAALKGGWVSELSIDLPLSSPRRVADAIAQCSLTTVDLLDGPTSLYSGGLGAEAVACFHVLTQALPQCQTLKHLALGHWQFVTLTPLFQAISESSMKAPLESVRLFTRAELGGGEGVPPNRVDHFKKMFGLCVAGLSAVKTLKAFTASVTLTLRDLNEQVLAPLKAHPSLSHLKIDYDPDGRDIERIHRPDPDALDTLAQVLTFASDCPSLTHFYWDDGFQGCEHGAAAWIREIFAAYCANRGGGHRLTIEDFLQSTERAQAITRAMANPTFVLRSLVVRGGAMDGASLDALRDGLKLNTTLEELDFSYGHLHFRSMTSFRDIFRTNKTLNAFRLPDDPGHFFLEGPDGQLYAFLSLDDEKGRISDNFTLKAHNPNGRPLHQNHVAAGQQALAPLLHEAGTFYSAIYDPVAQNRRDTLQRELGASVMHFMAAASGEHAGIFDGMNRFIVGYMDRQNALPSLVRLAAVNKATASERSRPYTPSLALERSVFDRHSRFLQLPRNLDEKLAHSNHALHSLEGMWDVNLRFEQMRDTLAKGAIDDGDQVMRSSNSASVREVLRLAQRTVTTTETQATTTTTSAHAITTTTGAAFVAPANGGVAPAGNAAAGGDPG